MQLSWQPSLLIRLSFALHIAAAIAVIAGAAWHWALLVVALNHIGLTLIGLWPKSKLLGKNITHLSAHAIQAKQIAITIDDGPNPAVTPKVLDMLDAWGAKATFFCIGKQVQAYPELAKEIVRRGHHIENHSYRHSHYFSMMGLSALGREIAQAQSLIQHVTGSAPVFFRAPAGLRSPLLDAVLQKNRLELVSWTKRGFDTVTKDAAIVLQRLESKLAPGAILLLHDGNCAITANGEPTILWVLPKLLAKAKSLGLNVVSLRDSV